jgi:hypothetical protein
MTNWNIVLLESLSRMRDSLMSNEEERKKGFLDESKKTHSEEMQDELEPIPMPCPMHEDYDDEETNNV